MRRARRRQPSVGNGDGESEERNKSFHPINLGCLPQFNINADDWCIYEELLEQFFKVNVVDEERRVSVLITSIGTEAYKYLRDLCVPELPKQKSYDEICEVMRCQFSRRLSLFRERSSFYELRQCNDDSIKTWYARVKKQASTCSFGSRLEEVLKDKFVCGLLEGPIKDRLCEEEPSSKSLNEFFELALTKERIKSEASTMEVCNVSRKLSSNKGVTYKRDKQANETIKTYCQTCGRYNHNQASCRYKNFRCRLCGVLGHLQRICPNKSIKAVEGNEDPRSDSEEELGHKLNSVEVLQVSPLSIGNKPMLVNVTVENQILQMEIDTGSGVSLISYAVYEKYLKKIKVLKPTNIKLRSFSGEVIVPNGMLDVQVEWMGKSVTCTLLVIEKTTQNLMGRDWLNLFDWPGFRSVELVHVADKGLENLISRFSDLFKEEVGCYKYGKIKLKVKPNTCPRFVKPRPIPFAYRQQVDDELEKLEKTGMIERVESASWGTPLVPVLKSNGQIRICANYKITVNPHLEDVNHPLPRIEEIWAALEGGQEFTKLDFRQAYHHLELEEETKMLLAWSTHKGVFKVNRLPFGSKPAVSIFQREVEKTLQGLEGVVNFLDDIIVTGRNRKEHLDNLEKVFEKLSRAGFRFNLEKCEFFKPEVTYLGHVINKHGIQKDPKKISAVINCPRPSNVTEVRSFVGLINYFGKFIDNLADMLQPLYQLLQKGKTFKWTDECETAFKRAKNEISSDRILSHFDHNIPLCLYCDASNNGIAAILFHEMPDGSKRPISYASRILSSAEKNYSTIHKEALALYWGMTKFYQYLMGRRFTLYSDHKPLAAIFGEKKGIPEMAAGRLQRWSTYLSGFQYEFRHISSSSNLADALSRMPVSSEESLNRAEIDYVNLVSETLPISLKLIKAETRKDIILSKVIEYVQNGWPDTVHEDLKPFFVRRNELSVDSEVLMWGYRLVIPEKYKVNMLNELHVTHLGMTKMKTRARSYFWWPLLDADIEKYCKACSVCMSTRKQPPVSEGSWPAAEAPFERVHVDYAGPVNGKYYFIVTDAFSKWPEVSEVNSTTAEVTIKKLREIFARFGVPKVLVSDNGSQFTSADFERFCKFNVIHHIKTPPFHPSSNGAAENYVKTFKKSLLKHVIDSQNTRVPTTTAISRFLFSYRISIHCTTGETPARRMFGRELRNRLDILREDERRSLVKGRKKPVTFRQGEVVYVRDYRVKGTRWIKATVLGPQGGCMYLVHPDDGGGQTWRRHVDQILKCFEPEIPRDGESFEGDV